MRTTRPFLPWAALALTAAVLALAAPAPATGTASTVEVGGSAATASYQLTASAPGTLFWAVQRQTTAPLRMTCASGNVPTSPASTAHGGTGVTDVMSLAKVNFSGCGWPGGSLAATTTGPWRLHRTGGTVTAGQTDVVSGHLEDVSLHLANRICDVTLRGRAEATFDEATQRLTINETGFDGDLEVVRSTNPTKACGGQVPLTSLGELQGTFTISTSGGPINLVP